MRDEGASFDANGIETSQSCIFQSWILETNTLLRARPSPGKS